jgi:CRP/FNR family cyclic AMP-dependent transcriptional regulator
MALVSGPHRRTATATALDSAGTIMLHQEQFDRLRRQYPAVDRHLIQVLAQRIRRQNDQLLEVLFASARLRVLRGLLRLADLYGDASRGEVVIPLSQDVLASLAGASRPTTNQVLRAAEKAGTIAVRRSRIQILDRQTLARQVR